MKNCYFLLAFALASIPFYGQIVNIPDANFKAQLLAAAPGSPIAVGSFYNTIAIDTNGNGEIEVSEALLVTQLNVSNSGISSLEGIASFTNLNFLNCTNNNLTTFDFSAMPLLTTVRLSNNQLATLTASQFHPAVKNIYCDYNSLSSLDLNSLVNLAVLNCSHNQVATLHVEQINNKMKTLDCSYNQLTSLQVPNFFPFLDMGDQNMILDCSHNQLTEIAFDQTNGREDLSSLNLSFNNFTALHLANMTVYGGVSVSNNPLTTLTFSSFGMGTQDPEGYVSLVIENTSLTELTIPSIGSSLYLIINNNLNLISLDIKNNSENLFSQYYTDDNEVEHYIVEGITIENNPLLAFVCCDLYEVDYLSGLLPNAQVNETCTFIPGGSYNTISGTVSLNCPDGSIIHSNVKVLVNANVAASFLHNQNNFEIHTSVGTQTISLLLPHPNYFTVTPPDYSFDFTNHGNNATANFCLAPNGVHPDLEVTILPITAARPGFDATYQILYTNKGNQTQSGSVSFAYDDAVLDLVTANPTVNSQSSGALSWDFTNLAPFESRTLVCTLNVNSPQEIPAVNIDDTLAFSAVISSNASEETPSDNTFAFTQYVVGSFDPNKKQVLEGSVIDISQTDDFLHYIIHFQNTGSAAAETVVVKDGLNYTNLDASTFQMEASSAPCVTTMKNNNVTFVFNNINLPPASLDEPGSNGFVAFKIKPKATVGIGSEIINYASIAFDYNNSILTSVMTTVAALGTQKFDNRSFTLHPNPATNKVNLTFSTAAKVSLITLLNPLGQVIQEEIPFNWDTSVSLDISNLKTGTYFITVETDHGKSSQKLIKL